MSSTGGANGSGQLGNGTTTSQPTPVVVSGLTNAVALTAGILHTCALETGGGVACWGFNGDGQLGDGTTTDRLTPRAVVGLVNTIALAGGFNHNCALRADGVPFCWGLNTTGQLGDGTTTDRFTPVEVPSFRFNIDPAVELRHPGRVVTVTALVACPEDQRVELTVALTQGEAFGEGQAVDACTGQLARYPVRVHAHGPAFFQPGPAEAEGVVRDHGAVVDIQTWTRQMELELVP